MNSGSVSSFLSWALLVMIGFALLAALVALAAAAFGGAFSPHASLAMDTFNGTYGTASTRLDSCTTCHTVGRILNAYGADGRTSFTAAMARGRPTEREQMAAFVEALRAIETLDSDGDGYPNGAEINARTFPGDSNDHPEG